MILPVVQYGDPILRRIALPVKHIDDKVRALASNMIETMVASDGCGLAGPQVGEDLRIFVVAAIPSKCFSFIDVLRAPSCFDHQQPFALINPDIKKFGDVVIAEEGCLSLPNVVKRVRRASRIRVRAMLVCGQPVNFVSTGLLSRIIQHEEDHLDGKLIIDFKY